MQGLQTPGEVVGVQEVGEVATQLVVAFGVVTLDGGILDGAAHRLDLALGPGGVGLVSRCSMPFASQISPRR